MQRLNSIFPPHTSSPPTIFRSSTVTGDADDDNNNAAAHMVSMSTRVMATTTTTTVNAGDIAPAGIQSRHGSALDAKEMRDVIFGHQNIDEQIHSTKPRSPFAVSDALSSSTSIPANRDETATYLPQLSTTVSLNPKINQQQPLQQAQVPIHQPHTIPNNRNRNSHAPKLKNSTSNETNERNDIRDDDEKQSVGLMMDFLTFLFELRPHMIKFASHSQLLLALPLLLHRIAASHAKQKASPLVEPLVMRLLACRKLKLRFLLMRHLECFQSISVSLRFSSRAYQAPPNTWITTACSLSHINIWAEPRPRALVLPVDMVDLQSDDFFSNVVFFNRFKDYVGVGANVGVGDQALKEEGCGHWRQMGQQLICHPFQTCGKRYYCDDVSVSNASNYISYQEKNNVDGSTCSSFEESYIGQKNVPVSHDESESEDDNDFEDVEPLAENVDKENEFLGQFGFICDHDDDDEPILEIRRIGNNDDEIQIDKLQSIEPRIMLSEQEDMLRFQAVQMLFHVVNSVWKSPVYHCEDAMSAPFCATLDHIAISQMKGLIESIPHTEPISTFNVLGSSSSSAAAAYSFSALYSSTSADASARGRNVWMDCLMRSAAGAVTIGYVIGLQLRQGDELAIKDTNCVFWQKFPAVFDIVTTCATTRTGRNSNTFGSGVTRLSIPKGLKSFFISHHMWDQFRKLCMAAFQTLRLAWSDVFPVVAPLFSTAGISHQIVNHYVKSRASLYLKHQTSHRAEFQFRRWLS